MSKVITFPPKPANDDPDHEKAALKLEPAEELLDMLQRTVHTHHTEIFEYNDDSYVVLVQRQKEPFTVERCVFMAERLKMELFDALPVYDPENPDNDDEADDPVVN